MRADAVLLMVDGGPDRLEQVDAYDTDIRRGSPPSTALPEELLGRDRAIGGGSPPSAIVERQRAALEAELAGRGLPHRVIAGMKHFEPRIATVVRRMAADIDIEAAAVAPEVGVRLERTETMNDDRTFIAGSADLVTAARRPACVA